MINLSQVAQRICDQVEGRAALGRSNAVTGADTPHAILACPGTVPVLACGLIASIIIAVLPLFALQDPTAPHLLIFPPWMTEEQAFRLVIADGGRPISIGQHYPLAMTGMVAAFPANSSPAPATALPLQLLLTAGCLTLPQRVPYAQ
jgi:hypothetical protein